MVKFLQVSLLLLVSAGLSFLAISAGIACSPLVHGNWCSFHFGF